MARLRKPSPNEPIIFMPPTASNVTRTSPRKATRSQQHTTSSDSEENSQLVPKSSRRELRYTNPSTQNTENSILVPKTARASDALTPRKQRILRPVESNSRLLRKLSDESLATPEKRQRERRIRSGTMDTDVGKKTRLMYAKILAKSVAKKQASRSVIDFVSQEDVQRAAQALGRKKETAKDKMLEVEVAEEEETSLLCDDEEHDSEEKEDVQVEEIGDEDEDEDEDDVVFVKQRQHQAQRRCIDSDSEEEQSEQSMKQPISHLPSARNPMHPATATATAEPQLLTSMRPPHRKGHSTISNWAQEVIDLTSSPEAKPSIVLPVLPPPTRTRTASLVSSRPQTSSSTGNGALAVLTYSPTPTKLRSPCKAPPIARPITPPLAPPSPSKLVSPSKKKSTIPKAPDLRPSLDAFWNPEVVNSWNEQHSPTKPLVSPKKQKWRDDIVKMMDGIALSDNESSSDAPSPTTSPRKKATRSPTKKATPPGPEEGDVKSLRATQKAFTERKHALALSFLTSLDDTITSGLIASLSASTGGIKLIWSKTLQTTAGRATWRREVLRLRTSPSPSSYTTSIRHHATIDLATRIITCESRLYNVLAHEFCHLATFMISDVRNNPHGAEFQAWGRKTSEAFKHLGVEVTTKHSYAIEYKYIWECVGCGCEVKRQTRSVDTERMSCGKCRGKLVQRKPVPRKDGGRKEGGGEYQAFVKENFGRVRREMLAKGEDGGMGRVMEAVAREYRAQKGGEKGKETAGLEDALEGLKI